MDNEYEKAWNEGEEASGPAQNAVKSAAEQERDRQAKEFSDAFFADEVAPSGVGNEGETQVEHLDKVAQRTEGQAEPGDPKEDMTQSQSDEDEVTAAAKAAKAV